MNNAYTELRKMWEEADKKAKDWRDTDEKVLLARMFNAWCGLRKHGWRQIEYCPKDGTRFLGICPGSTGVFIHWYEGEWPNGKWWSEAHGDIWPSRPILWKPLPNEPDE